MTFDQDKYIKEYNKDKYKMYQFRVKKSDKEIIEILDSKDNKNQYIINLIKDDVFNNVYTLKQIKTIIKPIMQKYGINEVYLFGSYARGEANGNSDIDLFCEKGIARTFVEQQTLIDELEENLGKKVDIVTFSSKMNENFEKNLMEDRIKLW